MRTALVTGFRQPLQMNDFCHFRHATLQSRITVGLILTLGAYPLLPQNLCYHHRLFWRPFLHLYTYLLPDSVLKNPFYDFHSMFQQFNPSIRSTLHRVTFAFVDWQYHTKALKAMIINILLLQNGVCYTVALWIQEHLLHSPMSWISGVWTKRATGFSDSITQNF